MKKLELKNLKVIKLTSIEKKNVKGGVIDKIATQSSCCYNMSGPYISWCNSCG